MSMPEQPSGGFHPWWREVTDNEVFTETNGDQFKIFFYLVMKARWRDAKPRRFKGVKQRIALKRGQLLTSRARIAQDTGVEASKVKYALEVLETRTENIQRQRYASAFTVITIRNYAFWADLRNAERQQDASGVSTDTPATRQQHATDAPHKDQGNQVDHVDHLNIPPTTSPGADRADKRRAWDDYADEAVSIACGWLALPLTRSLTAAQIERLESKSWLPALDALHRLDGHSWERIGEVCRAARSGRLGVPVDDGKGVTHRGNVRSPGKLRVPRNDKDLGRWWDTVTELMDARDNPPAPVRPKIKEAPILR